MTGIWGGGGGELFKADPGLKFNLLLWIVYFCMAVYFKT
jgi:hypothetical protein